MQDFGEETFGDRIRIARARTRMTLRQLGIAAGTTASYLSDIENGRRVPSESLVRAVAGILELDPEELLAAAGRLGEGTDRYLRRNPDAGILLRRMSSRNLSGAVIRRILTEVPELRNEPSE